MLRVFVDANVLYSKTLRDWLFLLRLTGSGAIFQLHSTHDVVHEAMYHLRRRSPLRRGSSLEQVRQQILQSLDEVVTEFDPAIQFPGRDVHDRHVHAAAVACRADILITQDRGFLNLPNLDELDYEVYHPDDFFVQFDDSAPRTVMEVTQSQRRYWATKKHHSGLAAALRKAGCPNFAVRVEKHLKTLSGATIKS